MAEEKRAATPSAVMGNCRLCGEVRHLCDSHLLPAALYRLLISTTVNPPHPLVVTPTVTFTTSRQVSDYLLCVDCEERFRVGGEECALRNCYRIGEGFRLRDLALRCELLDDGLMGRIYSCKTNTEIEVEKLAYFAASVFWRAAVHRWHQPTLKPKVPIELGPHQELLRQYLLGNTPFPNTMAVWLWLSQADPPSRVVTVPHSYRMWSCHIHCFDIPGMRFTLPVSRTLPDWVRLMCIVNGPDRPILISDAPDDILRADIDKLSKTSRLSRALARQGKWSWS